MSNNPLPIAKKISRIYQIVALIILVLYGFIFKLTILATENQNSMHLLSITAPYHFQRYEHGEQGIIKIDPLLTIYDEYAKLPHQVKRRLAPERMGLESFHFEDDSELAVFSQIINSPHGEKNVWALLNIDATEWSDTSFILIEIALLLIGVVVFLIAGIAIQKIAKRLAQPFSDCASLLRKSSNEDFSPVSINGEVSQELANMITAINTYRSRIKHAIKREKSFTRYISHEIRTPMTVIKGSVSLLQRSETANQKQLSRITNAVADMEQLTNVLLLLARKQDSIEKPIQLTHALLSKITSQHTHLLEANNCQVNTRITEPVELFIEPLLFESLLNNLLINAINCSENSDIVIELTPRHLNIIDCGIGLNEKPRGYEGFGIGLTLVQDICQRYNWRFELIENKDTAGCTATVYFD